MDPLVITTSLLIFFIDLIKIHFDYYRLEKNKFEPIIESVKEAKKDIEDS